MEFWSRKTSFKMRFRDHIFRYEPSHTLNWSRRREEDFWKTWIESQLLSKTCLKVFWWPYRQVRVISTVADLVFSITNSEHHWSSDSKHRSRKKAKNIIIPYDEYLSRVNLIRRNYFSHFQRAMTTFRWRKLILKISFSFLALKAMLDQTANWIFEFFVVFCI